MYNSEKWIGPTLKHLDTALANSRFNAEIIVIDDGSTDKSIAAVRGIKLASSAKLKIVTQSNKGRYLARKAGVEASKNPYILFVDSRVYVGKNSLRYLYEQLQDNPDQIWNGHVYIDKKGSVFTRFWDAIVNIAWRRYFKSPKETQYSIKEFDYYPKGTGFFFVSRKLLMDAMKHFETTTNDIEHSSDDTLLIRFMNKQQDIHLSPKFDCLYHGRTSGRSFFKHAYHRGEFFIDGFLRPGTRFFIPLIIVLVASLCVLLSLILCPQTTLLVIATGALLLMIGLLTTGLALGLEKEDAASLSILSVPFAFVYLLGLWRGVTRKVTKNSIKNLLFRKRHFLRGTIFEYIVTGILYGVITVALTGGVLLHINTQLFTAGSGDATAGFLWLNYADPGINPDLSHTNLVNYPSGEDLGGPTLITYSALWLPLRVLSYMFGPVAGLNCMMLIGFLGAAMSGYWLLKRLTGSKLIAFFAGYAIAFVPYNIYKSVSHLAYLFCFPFVLIFASFYGLWRRPTKRRAVIAALAVALAFYTDGYYLLIGSVTIACLVFTAYLVMLLDRKERAYIAVRTRMIAFAALVLFVCSLPIGYVQLSQGSKVATTLSSSRAGDPMEEMRAYRSRWEDFLLPSGKHPVLSHNKTFELVSWEKELRSTPSECMNYIGYGVLTLTVIGFILLIVYFLRRKYSSINLYVPMAARKPLFIFGAFLVICIPVFLSFMFSPMTAIHGHTIYLPGGILAHFGIGFWRVLARFFIPMHVLFVIFAALVLNILYSYTLRNRKQSLRVGIVIFVTLFTSFEYLTTYNTPVFDFTKLPTGYYWLKKQENIKVVAELPMVDALDGMTGQYVTAQIVHGKKLVNMKEPSVDRLNNAVGGQSNPEAINLAYDRGAQAVITHDVPCINNPVWGSLLYDESKHDTRARMCIYKLERPINNDDDYILFGNGFTYTPVRVKPYEQSALIGAPTSTMRVTDQNFRDVTGKVRITAKLEYVSDATLSVSWAVSQNGTVLTRGTSSSRMSDIKFTADAASPINLTVTYNTNNLTVNDVDTYLYDTVAY